MDINLLLRLMAEKNASDLFFSTGAPPHMKVEGVSTPIGQGALPSGAIKKIAYSIMNENQIQDFEEQWESNFAYTSEDIGRFRVNVFMQRGEVGMVMRHIKSDIPTTSELGLPSSINNLVMERVGLVLVCGPTGSGKSSTLAAMIEHRNRNDTGHILTIEDPIEFLYTHKKSIIDQREIGVDTKNYANAMKNAMREAPDVILIGEIRDSIAMEYALSYAQTGHLCLATIHGNNAKQVLERIRNMFPKEMQGHVLTEVAGALKGIISQRLIRNKKGLRIPALEITLAAPEILEIIQRGQFEQLAKSIASNKTEGMVTFDQSLYDLFTMGEITQEMALHYAESKHDLNLKMRLAGQKSGIVASPDDGNRFKTKL